MANDKTQATILLPELPNAAPLPSVVLFGFDDRAFPFVHFAQAHLIPANDPRMAMRPGPAGSHDENLLYYGSVIHIGDLFHMWYCGSWGPLSTNFGPRGCVLCYATSRDGLAWEKPNLGLVQFKGSRANNIVDFPVKGFWAAQAILHEPDDPDPQRRFKMVYEAEATGERTAQSLLLCVAFSADGLHWTPFSGNPVGPHLEMAGLVRHPRNNGLYYVNGQGIFNAHHPSRARRLTSYASADFERWSPIAALGLDRSPNLIGPTTDDHGNEYEEIHLGAAIWNRGNVMVGTYGMWHGHPSGDRRLLTMDLGLVLSHDAIHFHEPIPGFRLVPAREQPESPWGIGPALMQGQGMENFGDQTLYWFSLWRGHSGSGVRVVMWERDRLGMLKPYEPAGARAISCPIQVVRGEASVELNAGGLNEHSRLRVGLLDRGFQPIAGYSGDDAAVLDRGGLRLPVRWRGGAGIPHTQGPVRLDIRFEGLRPEDARLYAAYIGAS